MTNSAENVKTNATEDITNANAARQKNLESLGY